MPRRWLLLSALLGGASLLLAGCGGGAQVGGSSSTSPPPSVAITATPILTPSPSAIAIVPADFGRPVTNPWFPLLPGMTWVSKGKKDGKSTVDTMTVTHKIRIVAGVRCTVVRDVLTHDGRVEEATWDWYTQDRSGNVWYFGEDTREFDAAGKVISTEGSWETGVNGATPGIFMPAHPRVGQSFRQEFLKGQAADQFEILSLSSSVRVPYASFGRAMLTKETTPLEPGVVDHKYYVKGIGQVGEATFKGPRETSFLTAFAKP